MYIYIKIKIGPPQPILILNVLTLLILFKDRLQISLKLRSYGKNPTQKFGLTRIRHSTNGNITHFNELHSNLASINNLISHIVFSFSLLYLQSLNFSLNLYYIYIIQKIFLFVNSSRTVAFDFLSSPFFLPSLDFFQKILYNIFIK